MDYCVRDEVKSVRVIRLLMWVMMICFFCVCVEMIIQSKRMTKLLRMIITHPHCKWSRNSKLLSRNRSAIRLISLYACVYTAHNCSEQEQIFCSQLTSRCVSVSKIRCRNFNSHEWLFHLNVAGGDNVCLVIQTRQRQDTQLQGWM